MDFPLQVLLEAWAVLLDSAAYVVFGIVVAGLLKVFLSPASVARHLGKGRIVPVLKAAALGVPMPLCSCGVMPAAVSIKKQGANNGATTAFLISTPESGVDSIAITYALLDPIMTMARPLVACVTAVTAGIVENLFAPSGEDAPQAPDLSCPVDGCCDGNDCDEAEHAAHHSLGEKLRYGLRYAFTDLWGDLAIWFFLGITLSGLITTLVPEELLSSCLGGGIQAMLIMLVMGIPLYICATASTPIAAALILKGASPGAALVFLLAGPATNVASLTVLLGVLGRRATAVYLASIAVFAVASGLALDWVYAWSGVSARAVAGQAAELVPFWAQVATALLLVSVSVKPVSAALASRLGMAGGSARRRSAQPDPRAASTRETAVGASERGLPQQSCACGETSSGST
ncbi:SO_0444 family Cu/Zn efflux transporter [Planctomycetota bacterium]